MQKYMRKYCYSMGRFCVDVEKANIKKPLEMIDEAIRQICLWKQTPLNYDDPKNPPKETFFKYIQLWRDQCLKSHTDRAAGYTRKNFSADVCSKAVAAQVGVDFEDLQKCVNDSFKPNKFTSVLGQIMPNIQPKEIVEHSTNRWAYSNEILDAALVEEAYAGIYIVPSVIINKLMYGGNIDPFLVTEAICDAFETKPETCLDLKVQKNYLLGDSNAVKFVQSSEDTYFWFFIGAMIAFSLTLLGACVVCASKYFGNRAMNDMRREVGESVGNYMKLKNSDAEVNSGNLP